MINLTAKIRKADGKKAQEIREKGMIPAVLYGPKVKSQAVEVDAKEFRERPKVEAHSLAVHLRVDGK